MPPCCSGGPRRPGQIDNDGVIALSADLVLDGGVTVRGQHHRVSFDPDGGTPTPDPIIVFASSLAAGYRTMPAAPIRDPDTFNRWSTEPDGIGNPFTAASTLSCSSDGNLDRNGR